MQIHKVKSGETVFHIARKYNTSAVKIIENNGLLRPDMLSVGEELLILTPTRTHTVRGGETLDAIARRYGVKKSALIASNPALAHSERIYPEEELAIRYDIPTGGMSASLGYIRTDTSAEELTRALRYLTYFAIDAAQACGTGIEHLPYAKPMCQAILERKKTPLVRIAGQPFGASVLADKKTRSALIERMTNTAYTHGYRGIVLARELFDGCERMLWDEFLVEMRGRMLGCDLILFSEAEKNAEFGDYADGNILISRDTPTGTTPFSEVRANLCALQNGYESAKSLLSIPLCAFDNDTPISYAKMRELAYKNQAEIKSNPDSGWMRFEYTSFSSGKRERHRVIFPSMELQSTLLKTIAELGFMGTAVELSRLPTYFLMLLFTTFSEVEYAYPIGG